VEDSLTIRKFIKKTLSEQGYIVKDFESASHLLEQIKHDKPDLIVSDLEMPQMDGIQLVSLLKSDPSTSKLPVIIFTALDSEESKKKAFSAGATDFISKSNISLFIEKLINMLQELFYEKKYHNII